MTDTPTQLPTTGLEFVEVICYLAEIRPDGADPDADPDLFTIGGTVTLSVDTDQNLLIVRQGDDPARLTRVQDLSFTIQTSTGALIDSQGRVGFKIPRSDSTGIEPLDYTLSGEVRFTGATTGKRVVFKAIPTQTDGKLNIVDTIGLGTMTAAGVSLIPQRVAALEAQSGGGPGTPSSGAYPVQQVALTGNLAYTLPADAPTDQAVSVVFTQDGVGGRTVTYGAGIDGTQAPVRTGAGEVTVAKVYPIGGGQWRAYSDYLVGDEPTPPTTVTPTAPTWVDDTINGGGTWSASQAGVVYSQQSGTATPGQVVTITATPAAGYQFPGGAVTSWTHTFPDAPTGPLSFLDAFNRTDGNVDVGAAWGPSFPSANAVKVIANQCGTNGSTFAGVMPSATFGADQYSEADLASYGSTTGGSIFLSVRTSATRTGYELQFRQDGAAWTLRKLAGGDASTLAPAGSTILASGTFTKDTGQRARLQVVGSTVEAYLAGVLLATHTDPTPITTGNPGIGFYRMDTRLDNYAAGEL